MKLLWLLSDDEQRVLRWVATDHHVCRSGRCSIHPTLKSRSSRRYLRVSIRMQSAGLLQPSPQGWRLTDIGRAAVAALVRSA